jgi:hypothetical protein
MQKGNPLIITVPYVSVWFIGTWGVPYRGMMRPRRPY